MKQLVLLFTSILFVASQAIAQDSNDELPRQTFFTSGIGFSYSNVLDQATSPLIYSGAGGNVQLGVWRNTEKSFSQYFVRFDFNQISSEISGANIYSYRTEGGFQYFWKEIFKHEQPLKIYPGIGTVLKWTLRDHNSFSNNSQLIETRFSLGPALHLQYAFKLWSRKFETGMVNQLPVLSYIGRPIYASTKFPNQVNNNDPAWHNYLTGGKVYSLAAYFNFKTQSYLIYHFKNANALKLDYYWSFEDLKDQNPVSLGEHAIVISTLFKL